MKTVQTRLCIYPKDIQRITGKSETHARMLLKKIKLELGKENHQVVTIYEFCLYMGIIKQDIIFYLD